MALTLTQVGNNEYSVGSFEAKTYFAELLRKVQEGCVINITKNGKNVAVLQNKRSVQNEQALKAWDRIMKRNMQVAKRNKRKGIRLLTIDEITEAKNYGRKY
ncbi:MAG: type II toxin-antitoxin system prevent-host-death family antitoxin [Treponemataceae bacterium]|nr:type II toxin-antitoxin system prevent-host-death family antitoxin [Spirochaetales bacterium]MDY6031945.1 type II toxin-antitoxin system prevent-host-death family antitoxin [Treponemataceae bacterium]